MSQRLRNLGASLWLWNPPVDAQLHIGETLPVEGVDDGWQSVEIHSNGRSQSPSSTDATGGQVSTTKGRSVSAAEPLESAAISARSARELGIDARTPVRAMLKLVLQDSVLIFPVQVVQDIPQTDDVGHTSKTVLRVDAALLGKIGQGSQIPISFNDRLGEFEREALGARGFRLFANSIYNVATVRDELLSMQVPTLSSLQSIIRLQALDNGLTSLFLLIAIAGVVTSIIVLIANQIGNVQRKRDSLAQVRLLGLSKSEVSLLPFFTGIYLSMAGGLLGVAIAVCTAWVINHFFASSLGYDNSVCVIEPSHVLLCQFLVLVLTAVSSLFAAIWTTRVDPAEGMRYE